MIESDGIDWILGVLCFTAWLGGLAGMAWASRAGLDPGHGLRGVPVIFCLYAVLYGGACVLVTTATWLCRQYFVAVCFVMLSVGLVGMVATAAFIPPPSPIGGEMTPWFGPFAILAFAGAMMLVLTVVLALVAWTWRLLCGR